MFSPIHGDTFNCPAEIAEARYGLFVDRLELNLADGGEGRFRGGKGIVLEYRVRAGGCVLTCAYTRSRRRPWALAGGAEGSSNFVDVIRTGGARERHAVATMIPLEEGDVVRINTGSGAGYGDPRERPRELVLRDLRDGLLGERRARDVYGFGG
jgi:N-methylhydantoinase B